MAANTYSFIDVGADITGPNGAFSLGSGSAEEGITIEQADDKGTLMMGADGSGMHSLHAARNGTVTVTLLKTSPVNALLMDMYNADTASSANYGQNTIVIRDPHRGDVVACSFCGFRRVPNLAYAKDGNTHQWTFNAAQIDYKLGNGVPAVL